MKKVIFAVLAGLFLLNGMAHAQEVKQYTCSSIYTEIYIKKHLKEMKYNDTFNKSRGDTSYNGALTLLLLAASAATGSLPIIIAATLTPEIISVIVNLPSKEERVLKMRDESTKKFNRFLGRLQDNISANITAEEVKAIIQGGFDSGLYCENLPNLASPAKIRKHVKKALKAKYVLKN